MNDKILRAAKALRSAEEDIRSKVNHTLLHNELRKDPPSFNRICAAMDQVGDTTLALASVGSPDESGGVGRNYLLAWGVFQSIALLLNGCKELGDRMGFQYGPSQRKEAQELQDLRVIAAGHPQSSHANKDTGRKGGAHSIGRYGLSEKGFPLHAYYDDGTTNVVHVDQLLATRRALLLACRSLRALARHLDRTVTNLEEAFVASPASAHFQHTGYAREKLNQNIRTDGEPLLGTWAVEELERCVANVRADSRLFELWRPEFDYGLEGVDYTIEKLKGHFAGHSLLEPPELTIYVRYLCDTIDSMHTFCREIDSNFSPPFNMATMAFE